MDPVRITDRRELGGAYAMSRLAALAAEVTGFAGARVSIGDDRLAWVMTGPSVASLPRLVADEPVVLPDAAACDAALSSHGAATAEGPTRTAHRLALSSYVGVPVRTHDGTLIGALEVFDADVRTVRPEALAWLNRFAAVVASDIEVATQYDEELRQLDADRLRWQLAVEAAGVGSFDWDLVTNRLDWDETLMSVFGYEPDEYVPHIDSFTSRLHPDDVGPTGAIIDEAIAVSSRYRAEYRVVWPDGSVRWVAARGLVTRDPEGRPARMLGVAFDITEAHEARTMVRRARDRLGLLAAVSDALTDQRDIERAVGRLAGVLAPRLADYVIVSLVDDDGRLRDISSSHADPETARLLARYSQVRLANIRPGAWALRAVDSRRMVVVPFPAWESIAPMMGNDEARELITRLAPGFGLMVPLRTREDVVGLITLFNDVDTGPLASADQQVAAEVASRAAVALDAARSFQRQRRLAEALQRSMLDAPPVADDWQVAARYVPSLDDVQVGGDWYDAFPLSDGSLVVTVGDVMGHDSAAAAQMGQLRSMLRGIFFATAPDPGAGLSAVDDALQQFGLRSPATVVVARLNPQPDGSTLVRYSRAGHPPLVVAAAGLTRILTGGVDPPLGVLTGLNRRTEEFVLGAGETLFCYTDGLIERRDEDIDVGLERLATVTRASGTDPERLCDATLSRLTASRNADDVAVLAVRRSVA